MPESTRLVEPYSDLHQQREASLSGMWIFLATEAMLFGALFTAYGYYHHIFPTAFASASRHADFWLGTANTAILLTSSLTMALAVHAAKQNERRRLWVCLGLTLLLGVLFLGLKGVEYSHHIEDHLWPGPRFAYPDQRLFVGAEFFFYLYFVMTGLHAFHMIAGIGMITVIAALSYKQRFSAAYYTPVELLGLYWHFIDVIWLFLFPLFYLVGGH